MPLQTNLNVSPYFDDFQATDDFAKVLFKPGYPVQARELTTLQSILQNQIEKFGKHFFKEGAKVIPGNIGYNQLYRGIQLNNNYQGVPVSAYADQLVGSKITGVSSGVTAIVDRVLSPSESERAQLTLYVNYIGSSTSDNQSQVFEDGEELISNITILSGLLGNTSIEAGVSFATTYPVNAAITGASFQIEEGVYFFHGQFVTVNKETILLDQYTNVSNWRVGLFVTEEIINADIDQSLNDNSQGFNNYAAPGADRLKITAGLFKKRLGDFSDDMGGSPTPAPSPVVSALTASATTTDAQIQGGAPTGPLPGSVGGDIITTTNVTNVTNVTNQNITNQNITNVTQGITNVTVNIDESVGDVINNNTTNITNNTVIQAPTAGGGYFCELAKIENGIILTVRKPKDDYSSNFLEILARRTYAESGDYYVRPFTATLKNSLNNGMGNGGVFTSTQITAGGATPTNNLALYKIAPGKAFVRGWEIETINSTFLDCPKPRTTKVIEKQSIQYNTGPTLDLNNVFRSPTVGIGNTYFLSLRDTRKSSDGNGLVGKEIGVARIYDFRLESGSYEALSEGSANVWAACLYDVQTTTEIALNTPTTLTVPTFVTGQSSGATGFLKDAVSAGTALTCYEVTGDFINNESLSFDTDQNINRIAVAITAHSITDVESVNGSTNGQNGELGINTFTADVVQSPLYNVGIATISVRVNNNYDTTGISTITSPNPSFTKLAKEGMLLSYTNPRAAHKPTYSRIVNVGAGDSLTVQRLYNVNKVMIGSLPDADIEVTDLKIIGTKNPSNADSSLYTVLPKENIATVDLTDSYITIRKTFEVDIAANQLSAQVAAGLNETFLPFDEERYSIIRSDGTIEPLSSDKLSLTADGSLLQFFDLGSADTGAQLIATLKKEKPTPKRKVLNRVNSIIVDKSNNEASGIGTTSLNDGLTFGNYPFGTKVQDRHISLNYPDIVKIWGIYESVDTSDPSCPQATITAIKNTSGTTAGFIIGERITGQNSGAIAIVAEKINDLTLGYFMQNGLEFNEGEPIIATESASEAVVSTLTEPSFDVTKGYEWKRGQENTFWDYGRVVRKIKTTAPDRKIKIYFQNAYYESTDNGDIVTVESYDAIPYNEIGLVNGHRNSDIIDIRPRVSNYTVSAGARSPLEFLGRNFNVDGQNPPNILASDEALQTTYSFYLGRIDRIFLSKTGEFILKTGVPAENPERPGPVEDAIEICQATLPPYLYHVDHAILNFFKYKRYQMKDIKKLEDRIRNLEYYTSLSMLEVQTANMFVPDGDGLNRFKSGLFVDNFTTFITQESLPETGIKNSIDRDRKELRPRHYTNSVDLMLGPVSDGDQDETLDTEFTQIEGNNVRRDNNIISLDYSEVEFINQQFATRSESVTPFLISFWQGTIHLTPASDTWVDTVKLETKITEQMGNYAETMKEAQEQFGVDPQNGFGPIVWGSWEKNWTGTRNDIVDVKKSEGKMISGLLNGTHNVNGRNITFNAGQGYGGASIKVYGDEIFEEIETTTSKEFKTGIQSRSGQQTTVVEEINTINLGEKVVSTELTPYMRRRNIKFKAENMKPLTRLYAFFDGQDVTDWCFPKLIEITMEKGVFTAGERVSAFAKGVRGRHTHMRSCAINHKDGPRTAPTKVYRSNPYTNQGMESSYSSTSTILNIDINALANKTKGNFFGRIQVGETIKGATSGAIAKVTDVRLVSDLSSDCIGCFYIPQPHNKANPKYEAGTKTFTLINDADNDVNFASTVGEEPYRSQGTIEKVQEEIISVKNARIQHKQNFQAEYIEKATGLEVVDSKVVGEIVKPDQIVGWYDPLAQSFLVEDSTGVYVTSCDVFFRSKDTEGVPMVFQLRSMANGTPTTKILPFSEIVVNPEQITTSADGSVATNIVFEAPVYLEGNQEYAIALASNSTQYSVYVSRVGENDLLTDSFISNQPYLGSMFKSQNASTWEPSQWEDLKFTLYRADFLQSGSLELYNPPLDQGNEQVPDLMPNSLNIISKQVRVGLGTTVADTALLAGRKITQDSSGSDIASGVLLGVAGAAYTTMTVSNAGIGYTPADGARTVAGVNLVTIVGQGRGATAEVYIKDGVVGTATITAGGSGYQVGDVVGFTTLGVNTVGRDARLTIVSIGQTSELIVDRVQGDFTIGAGKTIMLTNASGNINALNAGYGGDVQVSSLKEVTDGLHIKVDHQNHGMYFDDNLVKISTADPDIKPTRLTVSLSEDNNTSLQVDNSSIFENFEGVGIGTTNYGYLRIGDGPDQEIVSYETVSGNTIGITTRGVYNVHGSSGSGEGWDARTPVYKYELGGVSLARINKIHSLADSDLSNSIKFDSYHVKVDMTENGTDRSSSAGYGKLFLGATKSCGGNEIHATQNMPFEVITPLVENLTLRGTSITASIRTTTAQSMSGNEIPWVDNGYEPVELNEINYMTTPRIIASVVNENVKLTNIPGNKSFNMSLDLNTTDSRLSPMIDAERMSIITTSNRVNSEITDFITDQRANSILSDPSACQYISKEITLEESASSIKLLVDTYCNNECDIRAFYYIAGESGLVPTFVPFPGYLNYDTNGDVISAKNNSGLPDQRIIKSNDYGFTSGELGFREYEFTADNLPSFRNYRIKLVLTSTNQVYVPRVKNLRVMALA